MNSSGYIDLQVNGYAGVDFNHDDLTGEQLRRACEHLHRDGVAGVLATIITDDPDRMAHRLRRIVTLCEHDELAKQTIRGLHIEGPFINPAPGYRGAHPEDAVRPADADAMRQLLDAGGELVRLVTLAPECDEHMVVTRLLADKGITVSAGHTDATLDELQAGIDAGLTMFTHLGNGCPMQMHRHDNIIQRVISLRGRLWVSFIADGVHVPFFALKNYLDLVGVEHAIIVTDAIAPAGLGPGRYTFSRWTLNIGQDMVARAPDNSHLVGSAITMKQSAANLVSQLGLNDADVRRMMVENPSRTITH